MNRPRNADVYLYKEPRPSYSSHLKQISHWSLISLPSVVTVIGSSEGHYMTSSIVLPGIRQQKCDRRATAADSGTSHISLPLQYDPADQIWLPFTTPTYTGVRLPGPLVDSNFSPKNCNFQRSTPATSLLPTLPGEIRYCVLVLSSDRVARLVRPANFFFKSDGNLPSFSVGRKHRFGARH